MMRIMTFGIVMLLSSSAFSQQSTFVPLTVAEQDAKNLRQYLDEQPMKFSLPILQWIDALEQRAKAEAEKKETPAK